MIIKVEKQELAPGSTNIIWYTETIFSNIKSILLFERNRWLLYKDSDGALAIVQAMVTEEEESDTTYPNPRSHLHVDHHLYDGAIMEKKMSDMGVDSVHLKHVVMQFNDDKVENFVCYTNDPVYVMNSEGKTIDKLL